MSRTTRQNLKWSINESLRLQREYELLECSISEMARLHKRSEDAIRFRLIHEGLLIETGRKFNIRFEVEEDDSSEYVPSDSESESESEFDPEEDGDDVSYYSQDEFEEKEIIQVDNNVQDRVEKLETSVSTIENMVSKLYSFITTNKT